MLFLYLVLKSVVLSAATPPTPAEGNHYYDGYNVEDSYKDDRDVTIKPDSQRVRRYEQDSNAFNPDDEDQVKGALNQIFAGRRLDEPLSPKDFTSFLEAEYNISLTSITRINEALTLVNNWHRTTHLYHPGTKFSKEIVEEIYRNATEMYQFFTQHPVNEVYINEVDNTDFPTRAFLPDQVMPSREVSTDHLIIPSRSTKKIKIVTIPNRSTSDVSKIIIPIRMTYKGQLLPSRKYPKQIMIPFRSTEDITLPGVTTDDGYTDGFTDDNYDSLTYARAATATAAGPATRSRLKQPLQNEGGPDVNNGQNPAGRKGVKPAQYDDPDANVEPKPDADVEPKPDADVEPKPDADVEPKPDADVEPKPDADVEPKPDGDNEPKSGGENEPKSGGDNEPKSGGDNEPKSGDDNEPKPDDDNEPTTEGDNETKSDKDEEETGRPQLDDDNSQLGNETDIDGNRTTANACAWVTRTNATTKRTTTKKTTLHFDIEKFLEIVANLTYDYYTNLTQQVNETLQKMSMKPTCPTLGPPVTDFDYMLFNDSMRGKCFVCGMFDKGIPRHADCADAFAGDFIPLVPQNPKAKGQIAMYRKYCAFRDVNNFLINKTMPRMMWGRWTGGCSVRWTDLSGVYTQRTCRSKHKAAVGKHYASKRMAKLEMALSHTDNGCIISPVATLLPLSRGISLFARFHACVCTGSWCNGTPLTHIAVSLLVVAMVTVMITSRNLYIT